MQTTARFDLKIDAQEKDVIAKAAALMGTTMAAFVRVAAKEKAAGAAGARGPHQSFPA